MGSHPVQVTFQTVEASSVTLCEAISPRYRIQQQNKALLLAQPVKTSNKLLETWKQAKAVVFVTAIDLLVIAIAVLLRKINGQVGRTDRQKVIQIDRRTDAY